MKRFDVADAALLLLLVACVAATPIAVMRFPWEAAMGLTCGCCLLCGFWVGYRCGRHGATVSEQPPELSGWDKPGPKRKPRLPKGGSGVSRPPTNINPGRPRPPRTGSGANSSPATNIHPGRAPVYPPPCYDPLCHWCGKHPERCGERKTPRRISADNVTSRRNP